MDAKFLKTLVASALLILACKAGWGQSLSYSNAIANLNPAGYWPMHEVEPAAQGDIETNYGSLGLLGNAYYPDYQVNSGAFIRQQPGPLGNGSDVGIFFTGPAGGGTSTNGLIVPRTSPLVTLKPPFSVECWYMATNIGTGQGDLYSECDGTKTSGIRVYYQNSPPIDLISIIGYDGTASGGPVFNTTNTSTMMASNLWHHIVITCNAATNFSTWGDGVLMSSVSEVGKYNPDTHTPFVVGTGLGFQRAWHGLEAEVAVYTNVITDIPTHYSDGTNVNSSASQYFNDVINDNPVIYLRLNAPNYTVPSGPWPTLVNYGQTNGVAIANGIYTPGTMPGIVSGASYSNFPVGLISTNVALLSGVSSFGDAGYAPAYNPTSGMPFSVTALFRGNPIDTNRVQSIVGHGTNSWELGLTATGLIVFNSGTNSTAVVATGSAAGDLVSTNNFNDGKWHLVVAVQNNGTNMLYVDGILNNSNLVVANNMGNLLDVMIGSDPCYTNTPVGLGRQFAGEICDVGFFTNALTLAQVQSLYNESGSLPKITQQPVPATLNQGAAFTNTVVASGSTPLFYQWYTNGVAIGGATNSSLIFNPALASNADTNYFVVVTNNFGAVTSAVVSLTVYAVPTFTSQLPVPYTNLFTLYAGVSPTFSVTAVGQQPIAYQWFANGTPAAGATNTSFTLTNVLAAFSSYCVLTNAAGTTTSFVWSASVIAAPTNSTGLAPYPQTVLALNPIGYWRMNDTNLDGVDEGGPNAGSGDFGWICHDYVGGNDGMYTNCTLGWPGYNPTTDPSDSSAQFGEVDDLGSDFGDSLAFGIQGINFGSPHGTSVAFTVEAWVSGYPQGSDSGIVTLGWGGGGEQFDLDCGSDTAPTSHGFRFLIRDASGAPHAVSSTVEPSTVGQGPWYFLAAVVDEITNQTVTFYINGQSVGSASVTNGSGILSSTNLLGIGSRLSSATTNFNDQFLGNINDVAIFNYALSSNQILGQGLPPYFTQQPASSTNASYDGTLTIPAAANGTPTLSYKWFDVNANGYIAGQTNATLVVSNIIANDSYYLTVSNPFGTTNSVTDSVYVISGKPQIIDGPQNPFYAIAGGTATNSVSAYGSLPLAYQWQYSNTLGWVDLSGYRFSGAQSSTLTISDTYPSDAGLYQLVATNVYGATTSSPAQLIVLGVPLTFNTNGMGGTNLFWTMSPPSLPPTYTNGLLTLTTTNGNEGTGSSFYQIPQYIGAFEASFTYEALFSGTQPMADGATFCLQDDPRGAAAVGLGGGDLAVDGSTPASPPVSGNTITPSFELELNIFPGNGVGGMGYSINTNGTIGPTTPPGSVVLTNIPVDVTIYYANGQMALTFSNEVSGATYATNMNVGSIPQVLGSSTAYVGFTGSYGGDTSIQTITNFSFVSLATQTIQANQTNAVISWPASIAGYILQQNPNLETTNWVDVTNIVNVVGGQNQVIAPSDGTNMFYRLILQ